MNLNERISKVIEYSNLTSSEFADEIEVQRSSISHITSGRNKPSLDFITKVKERFPELEWDWLITGHGNMIKDLSTPTYPKTEKPTTGSLPDLFSLINDDKFGVTESEDQIINFPTPRDSGGDVRDTIENHINDSQRLESNDKSNSPVAVSQPKTGERIKRIILFFEDGKFESYES